MGRGLQALAVIVVLVGATAVGGYAYFLFTFGSADHTEFTLSAEEVPRDAIADRATANLEDPNDERAAVIDSAFENGSARTVAEEYDLNGTYVERNGSYHVVLVSDGPTVNRTRPVLSIERVNETNRDVVPRENLTGPDRRAVGHAHRAWLVRNTDQGRGDPPVEYVYRTVPDGADSVFVPEQEVEYVRVENRTFRVSITRRNVSLSTTEYRLERVAAGEEAFVDALVVNATGRLNESAARPLELAIENGTYVSRGDTYAEAERPIEPVARACGLGDPADLLYDRGELSGYVRYEGSYYRVSLRGHTTAA